MPNKWHQTIHRHTIEFSKNTHPPALPVARALTCELCSFWGCCSVSGATLPGYQTLFSVRNSRSWSDRECLAVPRAIGEHEASLIGFSGAVSAEPGFLSPSAPSRETVRGGAVAL